MSRPIIRIHNVETNDVVDREMTDEEFAAYEADNAAEAARLAEQEAKAQTKQALLDRLGITSEEAQLLIGGSN